MEAEKVVKVKAQITPYRYPGLQHHKRTERQIELGVTFHAPRSTYDGNQWVTQAYDLTVFGECVGGYLTHRTSYWKPNLVDYIAKHGWMVDAGGSMDMVYVPADEATRAITELGLVNG